MKIEQFWYGSIPPALLKRIVPPVDCTPLSGLQSLSSALP